MRHSEQHTILWLTDSTDSKSIILALAPLLASAAPAKRDSTSTLTEFNGFMADLDGDGKLEWHEMEGGRFTTVGPEHAKRYGHISARGQATTPSQWYNSVGNWFGVGLTDGHETEEACITTGNQVLNGLVQAHAASACTAFFSATTAGVAIDNGWNVFQVSGLADMSGANTYINYRW